MAVYLKLLPTVHCPCMVILNIKLNFGQHKNLHTTLEYSLHGFHIKILFYLYVFQYKAIN